MKTAKEFFWERTDLTFDEWQEEDVIEIMKQYASQACAEQRSICHFEWAHVNCDDDGIKNESKAILTAPEPKLL